MSLLYSQANITRPELDLLPTPAALGAFHHPYGFGAYVEDVVGALDLNGLKVVNEEFEVTNDAQRLFGVLEVQAKEGELITADDWKLLVGLRGSHDQSIQRGLSIGSQVLVCSNLCFNGNIGTINTKQTTNIEQRLPGLVRQATSLVPELAYNQERQYNAYKELELSPRHGDAALIELYRRGAFTSAQLGRAVAEWDNPSHEEHKDADAGTRTWSGWRLFNASTEALKPTGQNSSNELVRQRSERISGFLNEVVGL